MLGEQWILNQEWHETLLYYLIFSTGLSLMVIGHFQVLLIWVIWVKLVRRYSRPLAINEWMLCEMISSGWLTICCLFVLDLDAALLCALSLFTTLKSSRQQLEFLVWLLNEFVWNWLFCHSLPDRQIIANSSVHSVFHSVCSH